MGVTVDAVVVSVWQHFDGPTWAKVGEVAAWTSVSVEPRHLLPGPWTITMPFNAQVARINRRHILTFDFRGLRFSGVIERLNPHSDDNGNAVLELSGVDAMTLLGDVLCWPVPDAALDAQTVARYVDSGPTETVLLSLIAANYSRHYGGRQFEAVYAASQGRGGTAKVSLRFHKLFDVVSTWCKTGDLGVRVGLKETTGKTRADLTVDFYEPQDRSLRARLSHKVGTLRSWSESDDVPTATRMIEAGSGTGTARIFRPVVSDEAESAWGRRREAFADARDASDVEDLDARGAQDLADATTQSSFDLEAVDSKGMRFGEHFNVGDLVTIELMTGVSKVDRLNVVTVTSDSSGGLQVQLKPGNPDTATPLFALAALMRGLRKRVRDLELED